MQYIECFMKMAREVAGEDEAILTVKRFGQSCSLGLYRVNGSVIESNNEAFINHPDYDELCWGGFEHFESGKRHTSVQIFRWGMCG